MMEVVLDRAHTARWTLARSETKPNNPQVRGIICIHLQPHFKRNFISSSEKLLIIFFLPNGTRVKYRL